SILRRYRQLKHTDCLCKRKSTSRPNVPDETVARVRESFVRRPQKSTVRATRELGLPQQFQQDGASPHWNINVRRYLNNELRHLWIGRVGEDDIALFTWPPRSRNLTPCDFFLWRYIKDCVYITPLPRTLVELKE
ncbi:hypothetical protein B7P43_G06601, partial [Cryptotermes secundus]